MKLSILIRVAAIAGLALVAGVQPAPAAVCTSGNLNPVPFVTTPFAPATNTTPQTDPNHPFNNEVQNDLNKAFAAASPNFQYKLCGLDGIFIDPSGCTPPNAGTTYDPHKCNLNGPLITGYSWGIRTYPPNPLPKKRYIALSLGLWNNNNSNLPDPYHWSCSGSQTVCPPPFRLFYTAVLNAVVDMASPRSSQGPFLVTVKPDAFATNPEMSVLAILAHQFGHVYWFDSFVPTPGGSFANNFCGGIFYPGANWLRNAVGVPFSNGNRFVFFGDPPSYAGSHVPRLPGSLHSINSSGLWASVLAAFSPVEDCRNL